MKAVRDRFDDVVHVLQGHRPSDRQFERSLAKSSGGREQLCMTTIEDIELVNREIGGCLLNPSRPKHRDEPFSLYSRCISHHHDVGAKRMRRLV